MSYRGAFGDLDVYGLRYAIVEDDELGLCITRRGKQTQSSSLNPLARCYRALECYAILKLHISVSVGFGNGFTLVYWCASANGDMNLAR